MSEPWDFSQPWGAAQLLRVQPFHLCLGGHRGALRSPSSKKWLCGLTILWYPKCRFGHLGLTTYKWTQICCMIGDHHPSNWIGGMRVLRIMMMMMMTTTTVVKAGGARARQKSENQSSCNEKMPPLKSGTCRLHPWKSMKYLVSFCSIHCSVFFGLGRSVWKSRSVAPKSTTDFGVTRLMEKPSFEGLRPLLMSGSRLLRWHQDQFSAVMRDFCKNILYIYIAPVVSNVMSKFNHYHSISATTHSPCRYLTKSENRGNSVTPFHPLVNWLTIHPLVNNHFPY